MNSFLPSIAAPTAGGRTSITTSMRLTAASSRVAGLGLRNATRIRADAWFITPLAMIMSAQFDTVR